MLAHQLKLFEKAKPGDSVQIDVKVVKVAGTKAYEYIACDECTQLRGPTAVSPPQRTHH